jgi:hypothetical protein
MKRLDALKAHLKPGQSYRRADLLPFSKSVDRQLQVLVREGALRKLRAGIYYCPKKSSFGDVPADDHELVRTFLKDHRFLLTSPNAYNGLGVGTTQLYNTRVVYNHKRHGDFTLGGRTFSFRVKHYFPLHSVTEEFLLVDLMNNVDELAEDREHLFNRVKQKAMSMEPSKLKRAVHEFANASTRKFFEGLLTNAT